MAEGKAVCPHNVGGNEPFEELDLLSGAEAPAIGEMAGICTGLAEKRAGYDIESAHQIAAYFVPVYTVEFAFSAINLRMCPRTAQQEKENQKQGCMNLSHAIL